MTLRHLVQHLADDDVDQVVAGLGVTVVRMERAVQRQGDLEHAAAIGLELLLRAPQDLLRCQQGLQRQPQLAGPEFLAKPPVPARSGQQGPFQPPLVVAQRLEHPGVLALESGRQRRAPGEQDRRGSLEEGDAPRGRHP